MALPRVVALLLCLLPFLLQETHAAVAAVEMPPMTVQGSITLTSMEVGRKLLTIGPNFTEEELIAQFTELMSDLTGLPEEDIEVTNVSVDDDNGVIIVDFTIMFLEFTEDILLMPDDLSDFINDPVKLVEALLTLPLFTGETFIAEGVAQVVLIFPPPAPPTPLAVSVFSDPHFRGFFDQTYDVTGIAGHIYNILSDKEATINARFQTAYTSGIYVEPSTGKVMKMRPKGTWMVDIGIIFDSNTLLVSTERSADDHSLEVEACEMKPLDCFARGKGGSITVNGTPLVTVGHYSFDDVKLVTKTLPSFSRISLAGPSLSLTVDYVPAPLDWDLDEDGAPAYAHLNLRVDSIQVSSAVNGILGASARLKYDDAGNKIMKAYDKNGLGVLDMPVEGYEVSSLVEKFPLYGN